MRLLLDANLSPEVARLLKEAEHDAIHVSEIGLLSAPDPEIMECRHTFASLLIDAGANPKAVQTFVGHSKIQTTFDIYGHLLPGSHDEVRERMDAYLAESPSR